VTEAGGTYSPKLAKPEVQRELALLAARQHGVVSSGQLHALGLSRYRARHKVRTGWLRAVHRGVYAVGQVPLSDRGRYTAAVLACGPDAALSHRPAGELWGLYRKVSRIVVTVPRRRSGPPDVEVHESRLLEPEHFTLLDGIRVTSVARTLLDLAAIVSPTELARAIDRAERGDLFDLAAIDDVLCRARGRKGARALRRAVAEWRPSYTRSELETGFEELVGEARLPQAQVNVLVPGERHVHEVDAFWPLSALVVQLDGFAFHRTRRDRERDASTDADLELAGFRVLRLTWGDVVVNRARTARRLRLLMPR
jgi:very-short-patch-repair endonuclease